MTYTIFSTNGLSTRRRIVSTANGFLNFLGGYSIFQGPVVGIMLVDYFFVRKGNLVLPDLFTLSPHGRYYFFHGFNLRAFSAFVIGFLLPLPGFAGSFGHDIGEAATHMYALGWLLSFLTGSLAYYVISTIWKVPGDDEESRNLPFEARVEAAKQIIDRGFETTELTVGFEGGDASRESSGPDKDAHVIEKMA